MEYVQPIRDRKKIEAMKHYLKGKSIRDYLLFVTAKMPAPQGNCRYCRYR